MKVSYSVTFEFGNRPPATHEGLATGGREHVCAARAIKTARTALRPVNWTSMVCVLLERLDVSPDDTQADDRDLASVVPEDVRGVGLPAAMSSGSNGVDGGDRG